MGKLPKFSIGIDLGTTNCALAYVALDDPGARSQVLRVPQRDELHTAIEATTLPSFLYLPTEADRIHEADRSVGMSGKWLVGLHARKRTLDAPGRVAHSAKSWLAHHAVDPEARVLPWRSDEIPDDQKLSPLEASALLLGYLKRCWDERFSGQGDAFRFDRQSLTITVPASFDAASQRATLEAARRAGFPNTTRLLEEPQAAFYRWLEARDGGALRSGQRILVVDIGGGTSDFSLFEVGELDSDRGSPPIQRVAVSDHILLGGDNIDLALAYALESELVSKNEELNLDQWRHLLARARAAKEECLSAEPADNEPPLSVSLPSKGSNLLAGTRAAQVSRADARALLLEGFFPLCPREGRPERPEGALLEWGLPYAPDCAATRYLAEFLKDAPRVDAVLFNGGTLAAPLIRERLLAQLASWQNGYAPRVLENAETDLAVARGAAAYGAVVARKERRIEAGAARALYVEVATGSGEKRLVAILPRGAATDEVYRVRLDGLQLAVNQVARFALYQGAQESADPLGSVTTLDTARFTRLPALEAKIDHPADAQARAVPVSLESRVNELGLLEVVCVEDDASEPGRWTLAFNLRGDARDRETGDAREAAAPIASPTRRKAATRALKSGLGQSSAKASRILGDLESALGKPRTDWDLTVSRELGDVALARAAVLAKSEAQAESWFHLVGFLLRPGFGDARDGERLQQVQKVAAARDVGMSRRLEAPWLIMWRRLASGLSATEQCRLFDEEFAALEQPKMATAERIRLLGALERVDLDRKESCAERFLRDAIAASESGGYPAPYFAALAQLLGRALFHAGPEATLPPEIVVAAFARLGKLDWRDPKHAELIPLFLKAARLVDDRALDLPASARSKIAQKLEKAGAPPARVAPLREYVPLTVAEKRSIFGESLPLGLALAET